MARIVVSTDLRVDIDSIAAGGDGVGRLDDGRVVFVPRAAPGDRMQVRSVRESRRWLRAESVAVERASNLRRPAPCPLYDRCGGCQLQHLAYEAQLAAKGRIVGDALRRIGGLDIDDPAVAPAPEEFGYRNRLSFTVKRLRGGRLFAGFHHRAAPGRIVDVADECLLPEAVVSRVWTGLRAVWGEGACRLPSGRRLRLTVRAVDEGAVIEVEGSREGGDPEGLVREVDGLRAIWATSGDGDWRRLAGDASVHDRVSDRRVRFEPGAFAQVNPPVAAAVHRHVLHEIGAPADLRIVDAYCGVGIHGWPLAEAGARVVGLEVDPSAVQRAREDAPPGFTVVEGPAEDTLPGVLPADRVILNPPRTGVDERVVAALLETPAQQLVYVSCDPATLARDLARLEVAYRPIRLAAFDLFPQTSHVESVVTLARHDAPTTPIDS